MPNYTYKCKDCNKEMEIFLSIKDSDNEVKCNSCSSENMLRLFKPPSSKVKRSKEEIIESAKEEAREIIGKMEMGDQSLIRDIYGEK